MNVWSRFSMSIGAFTALGAVLWSGCGSSDSRYYCDSTGCYSCDGYGCSTVTPPTASPCTGNTSCAPGSVCTAQGCTQSCAASAECPQGTVCTANLCVPPGQPAPATKECTTRAECKDGQDCVANRCVAAADAGGSVDASVDAAPQCAKASDCSASQGCVAGKCETCGGAAGPCSCSADADCPAGDTCAGGLCTAASDACKYSSDCALGDLCVDGQCEASCASGTCAAGSTCVKGACKPNPTGPTCTGDAQCSAPTPVCAAGACAAACGTTATPACAAGTYCNQGACVPDTRPTGNCKVDTDCSSDSGTAQKCIGGICKYPCTTDTQCVHIDNRIAYCGADSVCRSFTEAHPQCTSKSDCTAGQDCVGNVCQ